MQQVDRSNKLANAKQDEIDNATAEFDRKQEREDNWRKTQLFNMADSNLKMHSDLQTMRIQNKLESLKDKIDIQTSLQSKRQQDNDHFFKENLRKEKQMNVTQINYKLKSELDDHKADQKTSNLRSEKQWVDSLVEAQRTENDWQIKKKEEIINDLRQNYAMQGHERKEQGEIAIKM